MNFDPCASPSPSGAPLWLPPAGSPRSWLCFAGCLWPENQWTSPSFLDDSPKTSIRDFPPSQPITWGWTLGWFPMLPNIFKLLSVPIMKISSSIQTVGPSSNSWKPKPRTPLVSNPLTMVQRVQRVQRVQAPTWRLDHWPHWASHPLGFDAWLGQLWPLLPKIHRVHPFHEIPSDPISLMGFIRGIPVDPVGFILDIF